jgi:hypothetical protein
MGQPPHARHFLAFTAAIVKKLNVISKNRRAPALQGVKFRSAEFRSALPGVLGNDASFDAG